MEDMSMEEEVMQDAAQAQTAPAEEPTEMSASETQSSVPAANGTNKLFNILGLVLAIGFVILDVLLLALFTLGAASAFDVELSVDGLTGYVQMLLAGLYSPTMSWKSSSLPCLPSSGLPTSSISSYRASCP